ncbi:MAG: site-specific integrase [Vicingaceae bacterium]
MTNFKLSILFLLQKARVNKKGICPLRCRITFQSKRKEFSTGLFINPKYWHPKIQKAKPSNQENNYINSQISLIKQKINQAFLMLQVNESSFDVEDVYLNYIGKPTHNNKTFLEVLMVHNNRMEKLVGINYAKRYYQKWNGTYTLLQKFIKSQYDKNDIALNSLSIKFLDDLDYYLKSKRNQKQITVNKCIQRVRKIIKLSISEGFLDKDPFLSYRPRRYLKQIIYLTQSELDSLQNYSFAQKRLQQVKDMFIFCCYTGLAFQEMDSLSKKHIIIGFDGNNWIEMYRKKTSASISIPILPRAQEILYKYQSDEEKLLPKISNQKFNSYLKEIAEIVGIQKKLTHHIARKTFATTILLYNNVPIEIVSELLGHSKIAITQEHYAKVVKKSISNHMEKLSKILSNNID